MQDRHIDCVDEEAVYSVASLFRRVYFVGCGKKKKKINNPQQGEQ